MESKEILEDTSSNLGGWEVFGETRCIFLEFWRKYFYANEPKIYYGVNENMGFPRWLSGKESAY